ncbi:unnamed protein product, partial [Vitis vinifera]
MAKRREELFLKNGSLLLEKLVCSFNGKSNPIRYFSDKELQKATNNYSSALDLHDSGYYKCYKGSVDDRLICVRKFDPNYRYPFEGPLERIINEIAIATQMSAHKNVLKLLGCCLETQLPTLVYEFPMDGSLSHLSPNPNRRIQSQPLLLKSRLRIAWEIANVAAYLHTAFPRPFIHRDIRLLISFWTKIVLPNCSISFSVYQFRRGKHTQPMRGEANHGGCFKRTSTNSEPNTRHSMKETRKKKCGKILKVG